MRRTTLGLTVMALGAALLAAPSARGQASVGKPLPDFKFTQPLDNGLGLQSMADLHGKPTLIEYWATW
jgi:hypothetical protein